VEVEAAVGSPLGAGTPVRDRLDVATEEEVCDLHRGEFDAPVARGAVPPRIVEAFACLVACANAFPVERQVHTPHSRPPSQSTCGVGLD